MCCLNAPPRLQLAFIVSIWGNVTPRLCSVLAERFGVLVGLVGAVVIVTVESVQFISGTVRCISEYSGE